jgi:hypothetical protein
VEAAETAIAKAAITRLGMIENWVYHITHHHNGAIWGL